MAIVPAVLRAPRVVAPEQRDPEVRPRARDEPALWLPWVAPRVRGEMPQGREALPHGELDCPRPPPWNPGGGRHREIRGVEVGML